MAVKAMLTAGTPIQKIRSLLLGDQFTEEETEAILQACTGFRGYAKVLFKHRVVNGVSCVMGFGLFIYYALFAFNTHYVFFGPPLLVGLWAALNLFRGPSLNVQRTQWGKTPKPPPTDKRRSFIKRGGR